MNNDATKLWEMIKHIKMAMLTTQDSDGALRSRPMAAQQKDFDGYLWFFTEASSHKVDEIHAHHQVNLSYVDAKQKRYISVSGKAQIMRDANKAKSLWHPFLSAWFPQGADSPEVALLRVKVEQAEYWESSARRAVQFEVTAQVAPPKVENKKLTLLS